MTSSSPPWGSSRAETGWTGAQAPGGPVGAKLTGPPSAADAFCSRRLQQHTPSAAHAFRVQTFQHLARPSEFDRSKSQRGECSMRFRRVGAAVTAAAVGGVLAVVPVGAAAAAVDEGLVLHYALTGEGSTAAVDLSGSGRDATIVGDAVVGADGLTFDGVDDYVDLPDNLTTGMDAISVSFDVLVDPALSGNHFMFNLGNAAVGNPQSGSGYLFMTNNATLLAKISDAAWGAEQAVTGPAALPR